MPDVPIPDDLYSEAKRAAAASGRSVEMFVAEAVQVYMAQPTDNQDELVLTPEQLEAVRKAQAEIKAGQVYTIEQGREQLNAHKTAWRKERRA